MTLLEALASTCSRCQGSHPTTLHTPRIVAAGALGRGEDVTQAALTSRLPQSTIEYWQQADSEFRALVDRLRREQKARAGRKAPRKC